MELDIPFSLRVVSKILTIANRFVRRRDYTINRRLSDLFETKVSASLKPVKGVFSADFTVDSTKHTWARVFVPCGDDAATSPAAKRPTLVYYHGGGFAVLGPSFYLYDIFCRRLAKMGGCVVVSFHYRRSPEHRYPAAHEDGYHVVKWLAEQAEKNQLLAAHADLSRCFLAGDSAGGNIAHHVGCRLAAEAEQGEGAGNRVRVRGHILIQPFFGGEARTKAELELNVPVISVESSDWHWKAYLPEGEDRSHPCCNVFGPRAEDISPLPLPPSVVVIGEYDILKDWQSGYVDGLRAAGKKVELLFYPKAVHAFHIFHSYPLSKKVLADMANFINEQSLIS